MITIKDRRHDLKIMPDLIATIKKDINIKSEMLEKI